MKLYSKFKLITLNIVSLVSLIQSRAIFFKGITWERSGINSGHHIQLQQDKI